MPKPTVRRMLTLLENTPLRLVERVGKDYAGDWDEETFRLSLSWARQRSKSDSLVQTLIHELVHACDAELPEEDVLKSELQFFKSRTLREACFVRLVNAFLFGEE